MSQRTRDVPAGHGIVRGPEDADVIDNGVGGALTFWARGEETGGAVTVLETVAARGMGPPLHVHVNHDEFIYVLEGRLCVRLGETIHDTGAGSFVFVPRNLAHTWQNAGDRPVRFLFAFAPACPEMENFFVRGTDLAADVRLAESFERFAADAGMRVLGPPLAESRPGDRRFESP